VETEREEKNTLTNQKNENESVIGAEEITDGTQEHEERSPPTNTDLASGNQQLEENKSKREEKNTLTIDNNNNNSDLSNIDLNTGLETKKEIKFTPDYKANEPVFYQHK
jgi:hypothetical protein